jgi:predicted permease
VIIPLTALPEINRTLGQTQDLNDRGWLALGVAGRLKEGGSIAQAQAQLSGLWPELMGAVTPADITGVQRDEFLAVRVRVESAARGVDREARAAFVRPLYAVIGLGILLFIVACLHLANVMLAYALRREQDLAVRIALGASRWGLVRQALTEALLVVVLSAGAGLIVARWMGLALAEFMSQNGALPLLVNLDPDLHVFALVTGCGALACIVCSSGTVWLNLRHDPARILQRHSSTVAPSIGWSAKTLLTAQVAISLVLLVSSASLVQYLRSVRANDTGFLGDGLLVARLYPRPLGYADIDDNAYYPALIERLSAQEGIAHAALVNYEPAGGFEFTQFVGSSTVERDPRRARAVFSVVSPGFFATMGMTTTQGRDLRWDDTASRPRVVVISRNLAERLFPSTDAVGQYIRIGPEPQHRRVQVVGVVQNARLFDLRQPEPFIVFVPWLQEPEYTHWAGRIVVRSSDDTRAASGIRTTLDGLGREYPMWIRALTDVANRALLQERLAARLAGAFAVFAVFLTAIGLYGVLSYLVVRRTREVGIRLALGATRGDVIFCMTGSGLVLVAVGVAIGLGGTFFSSSLLERLFRGVGMPAWSVFMGIAALTTVSLIAMYLPARRASLMPPMTALRQE